MFKWVSKKIIRDFLAGLQEIIDEKAEGVNTDAKRAVDLAEFERWLETFKPGDNGKGASFKPSKGSARFNTTTQRKEIFDGNTWIDVGGAECL